MQIVVKWNKNSLQEFHWRCGSQTVNVRGYHACWHDIEAGLSNGLYIGQIRFAKGPWTMDQRESPLKFYSSRDEKIIFDIPSCQLHRRYYINRHFVWFETHNMYRSARGHHHVSITNSFMVLWFETHNMYRSAKGHHHVSIKNSFMVLWFEKQNMYRSARGHHHVSIKKILAKIVYLQTRSQ